MVRPSEVDRNDFRNSPFQKGEKEAWAIFLLKMCRDNGDTFDQEFEWSEVLDFLKNIQNETSINSVYMGMVDLLLKELMHEVGNLIKDGYIETRSEDDDAKVFVRVSSLMIKFYEDYGKQPA